MIVDHDQSLRGRVARSWPTLYDMIDISRRGGIQVGDVRGLVTTLCLDDVLVCLL
jgi:hypothetical protein